MKLINLISIFIILSFDVHSQEDLPYGIRLNPKNNIEATFDTISASEFVKKGQPLKWMQPKKNENMEAIYRTLRNKYPDSFKDSAEYLILIGLNENRLFHNDTLSPYPKGWVTYTTVDYKNEFIIFHDSYYEGEDYVLFNPKNHLIRITESYPNFINSSAIFGVGTYEVEYFFEYQLLKSEKYFGFYLDEKLQIINYFNSKNKFYFEFSSGHPDSKNKYLRITLKNP
jgi:hypothetical protein